MKQISQNYKDGSVKLETVNAPALKKGGVLVKTQYSVISTGTEGMKVKEGKLSYLGKARARPDQVKKVMQSVQQQGLVTTYHKVMNRLDSLAPLGYSTSGVVVAVGDGAEEFRVGQRVACAGAGYANHSEVNFVPKNLVVAVPDRVEMEHAAFTTIGSIAMQGFRQGALQLGESACVIGLGLVGNLLVQLLRAAGVRVIGLDLVEDRCKRAEELGATCALKPDDPVLSTTINRYTSGAGVDCVFISAGGNTGAPIEVAAELVRDRGRVVDIGKTKMDMPWNDCYMKELDVRFSRSYGPGRYDPNYEEKGIDYPMGYVRWTERRNMAAFLELIASGDISIAPIVDRTVSFSEAEQVFAELAAGGVSGLGIVFQYPGETDVTRALPIYRPGRPEERKPHEAAAGKPGIGFIGAGNYASSMLLPYLARDESVILKEVATTTSLSAANTLRKYEFERTSTDYRGLLASDDIQAIVVATRHDSHADITAEALHSGKTVFVEKPLAIDLQGMEKVRRAVVDSENDRLMVGFNRRFSPMIEEIRKLTQQNAAPLVMHYRIHAGQAEPGSWYLDSSGQGTRFIGEAGHFFDVFSYLADSRPVSVCARNLHPASVMQDDLENTAVIVEYENGSIGNLLYLTQGGTKVPKEYLEVFGEGRTFQLNNFENLVLYEGTGRKKIMSGSADKGQKSEMRRFVSAVRGEAELPISLEEIFDTTLVTLAAFDSIRMGRTIHLPEYFKTIQQTEYVARQ